MRDESRIALASFSRQQEMDADEIGVRSIAKAGFEAHGATRFLVALDRSSRMRQQMNAEGNNEKNDILATHPATPERIQRAIAVARQYGAPGVGEADRGKWLQALDGMVYGDDPAQGLVRGRVFLHPRLKFALDAPEGFVLENTPQAVLGVTSGAKEALRLDSSKVSGTKPLRALLVDTPIEGQKITEPEALSINGFEVETGLARSTDWSFRVFLFRSDDYVYRLIMAAQNLTPAQDQRFRETAQSFRRLTAADTKNIAARRIRLVTAGTTDRPEDLVRTHMSDEPQALERFYVLNGLGPQDGLVPGAAYKVIGN
jgi:predicted Zn-dependent protease